MLLLFEEDMVIVDENGLSVFVFGLIVLVKVCFVRSDLNIVKD